MEKQYLTVSALTKYLKRKFDTDRHLKNVWLQAEISNFNHHSRGHMYFTLKDENARISAVMFASHNRQLKFRPENGMKVLIRGDISVYPPQGQYQIYVQSMQPDGIGALFLAYEDLKKKLDLEGLFQPERKKTISKFPSRIAIVTSPTGAAVRDIITTLKRRFPSVKRTILPVSVQGEQAVPSIVKAIEYANKIGDFDTIIVGRGGGSIEELWAFNEEQVARTIANSTIPVISAVGHETDFTISDFVADLRAPTPTAAAELAVPSLIDLKQQLTGMTQRLHQSVQHRLKSNRDKLQSLSQAYAFKYPIHLTRQKEQDLDRIVIQLNKYTERYLFEKQAEQRNLQQRLFRNNPKRIVRDEEKALQYQRARLQTSIQNIKDKNIDRFQKQLEKLSILNPLETMKRGYSITYKEGNIVKSIKQVNSGDILKISLKDGQLDSHVWGIEEKED
ncbi:exodeoxyribonuclease VII large subunit [Tenuibacillus multivorans]|uniref:Exodeoxyribonuclease 7 large subunit n=1 Tax=Tenuibacillus multivorans TaxID=237069 RepID=A0A1G9Z8H0_9BACI|nr:exodeoxyribonuclease VII large subunit [Tenuibacillus multivorans]GEL77373.1 exodeoxyribonuclease 7 large subunit [Tenuibacillus multivorans]SDN17111.1 exodeoxyribonuclease VII large subunit [Tenuibacillus multivorans]